MHKSTGDELESILLITSLLKQNSNEDIVWFQWDMEHGAYVFG